MWPPTPAVRVRDHMQVDLTAEELQLLREVLERATADLREEVFKTDAADWKRALKERERLLAVLIGKLGSA